MYVTAKARYISTGFRSRPKICGNFSMVDDSGFANCSCTMILSERNKNSKAYLRPASWCFSNPKEPTRTVSPLFWYAN